MLLALLASLLFTFTLRARWRPRARRAEMLLVPLLDILQSVPILGFISITIVVLHGALFPGRVMGAELAAIFAIFTSQAWNMAFSFYQSLRTVPDELDRGRAQLPLVGLACASGALEVPFAMPGAGVEHDDVDVGRLVLRRGRGGDHASATPRSQLPGIGSYIALAIEQRDLAAHRLGDR